MDVSVDRLGWYLGAGVAFLFAIGALEASLLATLLFAAAGVVALPEVRSALRGRGTIITTWLAAALLVMGLLSGLFVYSAANTAPGTASAGASTTPAEAGLHVDLSATDTDFENSADSLHVAWNGTAREVVDPQRDDGYTYEASDGKQYIVVAVNLTNTGERRLDLDARYVRLLADGVEYEAKQLVGGDHLRDVTLRPGASYQAHLTFEIPADVDAASLIANNEAYPQKQVAANFTHTPGLDVRYGGS
jgi:hypothetical protein